MSKILAPCFAENLTDLSVSKIFELTMASFRVSFFFKTNVLNSKTGVKCGVLRNREHLLHCETLLGRQVKVCGNEKCCRTGRKRMFPQRFRVLKNFHEYSLLFRNSDRNRNVSIYTLRNQNKGRKFSRIFGYCSYKFLSNFHTHFLSCLLPLELQNKVYIIVFTTSATGCFHDWQLRKTRRSFGGEVLD